MKEHSVQDLIDAIADDWMVDIVVAYDVRYTILETLLAPDGRLWPALRALGSAAQKYPPADMDRARRRLAVEGVTGPLADACLAAAEVKP